MMVLGGQNETLKFEYFGPSLVELIQDIAKADNLIKYDEATKDTF